MESAALTRIALKMLELQSAEADLAKAHAGSVFELNLKEKVNGTSGDGGP